MRAIRELDARQAQSEISAERLYDLILAATGDADAAERAFLRLRQAEMDAAQARPR